MKALLAHDLCQLFHSIRRDVTDNDQYIIQVIQMMIKNK